jgi:hypothetical protein
MRHARDTNAQSLVARFLLGEEGAADVAAPNPIAVSGALGRYFPYPESRAMSGQATAPHCLLRESAVLF